MSEFLQAVFGFVCSQSPDHTWAPGGELLPLCQRCSGLYLGGAIGALLHLILRPNTSHRSLWVHGGFLLLMVPFGCHLVPHGAILRTLTGQLFGFGVVCFLCLQPCSCFHVCERRGVGTPMLYWSLVGVSILLVPAVATWGGTFAAAAISWAALAGLAVLGALAFINVVLLARLLLRGLRRGLGTATA